MHTLSLSRRSPWRALRQALFGTALALAVLTPAHAQASDALWRSAGQNQTNTRHQATEHRIGVATVGRLAPKWVYTTNGDVSATPAVDGERVYVPDWGGKLHAVNRATGAAAWVASISAVTSIPGDKARATPLVVGSLVIVGTQGPFGGGGRLIAFDKDTGALRWMTVLEGHPAAIVTQSATAHGGRVFVGLASMEEAYAASGIIPGYPCCSFRGSMVALDVDTGQVLWKTYMAPAGYSGSAVWGSAPAIDAKRGVVYVATGNNYSVPDSVQACVAAAATDDARAACISPDNHFDAVVALEMATGRIRWATRALPFDAWTVDCLPFFGEGTNCPKPAGPDYDFAQAPALYAVKTARGGSVDVVGVGQKSGQYWQLDAATGAVRWVTQAGPGGTGGGLQWGSAVDGSRIYTANSNSNAVPWTLPDGAVTTRGVWSALDIATGQVLWQKTPSVQDALFGVWGDTSGPVSVANGVVFGCSVGATGVMYALDAATGAELWRFASGGSCLSGAAISRGEVFWGSGYANFGGGTPNNRLYAFELK